MDAKTATDSTGSTDRHSPAMRGSLLGAIATRYAGALLDLAREADKIDTVASDLDRLSAMLDESADLERLTRSPTFSAEAQTAVVKTLSERAAFDRITRGFIGTLSANRRLYALRATIEAFKAALAAERGEVTAEVTSATPLTASQFDALNAALNETLGKSARLRTRIDPSLIGGLIVQVGSRMVDMSLKAKLNSLRSAMKEVG